MFTVLGRQRMLQRLRQLNGCNKKILQPRSICSANRTPFTFDAHSHNNVAVCVFRMGKAETRNALCSDLFDALDKFIEHVAGESCLYRAAVVKSDVQGTFCAGADLRERSTMTDWQIERFLHTARAMLCKLEALPIPVLAAIDGHALGGGLEIALACDLRLMANQARVGLIETKVGVIPGIGGTQRLQRLINPSVAKELIFTGRTLDGPQAQRLGVVNHSVEQNAAGNAAYLKALEIAEEIASGAPLSVKMCKTAMLNGQDSSLAAGMAVEELCYSKIIPLHDRQEGLLAFKEKRKPRFRGK